MRTIILSIFISFFFLSAFSQTIRADEAKDNVGKTVTVLGKVVDGRYLASSGKQPTLLNIDKPFPDQIFTIVIYGESRRSFGYKPEEVLLNKNVLVTGKITMYNNKPQIEVTEPGQIVIATAGSKIDNLKENRISTASELITKKTIKLRSGPGLAYRSISKLKSGSVVKVLHVDGPWSYVSVKRSEEKDEDSNYTLVGFIKNSDLRD